MESPVALVAQVVHAQGGGPVTVDFVTQPRVEYEEAAETQVTLAVHVQVVELIELQPAVARAESGREPLHGTPGGQRRGPPFRHARLPAPDAVGIVVVLADARMRPREAGGKLQGVEGSQVRGQLHAARAD